MNDRYERPVRSEDYENKLTIDLHIGVENIENFQNKLKCYVRIKYHKQNMHLLLVQLTEI